VKFSAELQSTGGTTAGFQVPTEVVEALGGGKRPKVKVVVNGFEYRTSIAPMGGSHWLGVSSERRAEAGVSAGEVLEVDVELDTAPRVIEPPVDLSAELEADVAAMEFWASLSYSNQRYHVEQIEGAKAPETRRRRIAKTMELMQQRKPR
jgi:hypothetical protein